MAENSQKNNQDQDWWFAQSGEYVLGTLPDDEHQVFHKILEHDFDAQMYVSAWLQQLQPMSEGVRPMNPPPSVWQGLQSDLMINSSQNVGEGGQTMINNGAVTGIGSALELENNSSNTLSTFARSLFRARQWATVATIAAAAMAFVLLASLFNTSPKASSSEFDGIAVLGNANNDQVFTVDTSSSTNQIRVTSHSPPSLPAGKTYQLWAVKADGGGVDSLVLVGDEPNTWSISDVDSSIADSVAIAVSVEPIGGSTVTGPTGRVLFQGPVE